MAVTSLTLLHDGTSTAGLKIKANGADTSSTPSYGSVSGTVQFAFSTVPLINDTQKAALSYTLCATATGFTGSNKQVSVIFDQTPISWANVIGQYVVFKYSISFDGATFEGYLGGDQYSFFGLKPKVGSWNNLDMLSVVGSTVKLYANMPLEGSSFNKNVYPGFVSELRITFDYFNGSTSTPKDLVIGPNNAGETLPAPTTGAKVVSVDNLKYTFTDVLGNVTTYQPGISFCTFLYTETSSLPSLVHKPLQIYGVHGSLMSGNYIWGSSRWGDGGKNIVKINMSNFDDVVYLNILTPDTGLTIANIEQMVQIGKYLYCLGDPAKFIQIDSETNAYKVFTIPNLFGALFSVPLVADDTYLYIMQGTDGIIKVRASDLENPNLQNGDALPVFGSNKFSSDHDGWNMVVHSAVIDANYIYAAYTTGVATPTKPFYLSKVNKNTLELAGWVKIAKSTDDMTQNADYLYFGIEVQPASPKEEYGYGWGGFAVRKSDLQLFPTNKMGIEDNPPSTTSYASLFFGKTLLDSKTNQRIYVLDTEHTDQWSLGWEHAPIVRDYYYAISGGGTINELLLNYDTQTFYGFVWTLNTGRKASGFVSFKLPDIVFTSVPVVSTQDPVVVTPNQEYTLKASIDDTGNAAITAAGFKVGNAADNLTLDLPVSTTVGAKTATLNIADGKSKFYRFYATNSEGTAQTPVRTIEVLDTPLVSIQDPVVVTPNQQYTLKASIDGTGGSAVTAAGFKVGNNPSNLTQTISVSTTTGAKTANLNITDAQNKYVQFFATNGQGTRNSEIKTITVAAADEYILKGKVFKDGAVQAGATILLIDIATNQVLQQSNTDALGEYNFVGLAPSQKYYVAGYYTTYRIVSKLLTSFKKV